MINKIITSRFLSGLSFYSFLPFYSIYLINYKGISEENVAVILFIFLFISRACSLFTHYIIDAIGYKLTLIFSYLVAAISLLSIYAMTDVIAIMFISAIIGAGFSIANVCTSLFIAENNNHAERVKNFSILNVAVNISSAIGGVIGEWFYHGFYSGIIILPAVVMLSSSLYSCTLNNVKHSHSNQQNNDKVVATFSEWVLFVCYSSISFFMIGLILRNLAFHFEANHNETIRYVSVSSLFALNAILIILLQVKSTSLLSKQSTKRQIITYKLSLVFVSILLLLFDFQSALSLYLLIILFTLSELIWSPYNNSLSIEKCPFKNKKLSLSLCIFFWGLAESGGAYMGIMADRYQLHVLIPFSSCLMLISLFSIEGLLTKRKSHESDYISRV
ncbi:MFS transporter [Providencia vermicola]|uniref:MFS transporter n=1 Tax=Providencia TaxID=586 RepID=UPI00234B76BC|nr:MULTISPECIES: MFS transporter [Providencia]ELR5142195.1 MFS transporter [Providencia stuartii]WER21761.1 MFS transporter [Providencia stuartii]WER25882.1 MFS transporter [Providencia stuartii]WER29971.1 MFS transporter [Providencia stuartii]